MAAWRRVGTVERFRERLMTGMNDKGYDEEFADAVFRQIRGFGEYGFPESHAASFALLVYVSAWLKCHEPAAFCCAIMNSLPMGFYSPSDLVADARRHGVTVLDIDINQSTRDHHLVPVDAVDTNGKPELQVRLGFRLVRNLSRTGTERLLQSRSQHGEFHSVAELVQRTGINARDQQALAAAGALKRISGNRHRAHWDLLGVERLPGLLESASSKDIPQQLSLISEGEDICADYDSFGFTLGRHPLALLRDQLTAKGILSTRQWLDSRANGQFARVAGLVKVRQRPGSAKGVIFMTTEDETGLANMVIWQNVTEQYRKAVIGARMVMIAGTTQREGEVVHLIAKSVEDYTWMLGSLSTSSRDFH
jgi:error-prone DNA polymerase